MRKPYLHACIHAYPILSGDRVEASPEHYQEVPRAVEYSVQYRMTLFDLHPGYGEACLLTNLYAYRFTRPDRLARTCLRVWHAPRMHLR